MSFVSEGQDENIVFFLFLRSRLPVMRMNSAEITVTVEELRELEISRREGLVVPRTALKKKECLLSYIEQHASSNVVASR
jgi:hypothetical protein